MHGHYEDITKVDLILTAPSQSASQIFTQQWFIQVSQQQDQVSGKVTRYTIAPQIQYPDENTAIVTLTVTRSSGASFHVELHLRPVGGEWKIFSSTTTNA